MIEMGSLSGVGMLQHEMGSLSGVGMLQHDRDGVTVWCWDAAT